MIVPRPHPWELVFDVAFARRLFAVSALILLAACQTEPRGDRPRPVVSVAAPSRAEAWMAIASPADVRRLANVTGAWAAGLAEARRADFIRAVREEGTLLQTGAGLALPAPTPGSYNCRLVRLGSSGKGKPAFEKFKPF